MNQHEQHDYQEKQEQQQQHERQPEHACQQHPRHQHPQQAAPKRLRSCIACGTSASKRDLVRIVRTPEGSLQLDTSGKKPGRGAYVCSLSCFEQALRSSKLQRALKTNISQNELESLTVQVQSVFIDKR